MDQLKYISLLVGVFILGYWLLPDADGKSSASAETVENVVYLCKETKQVVKAAPAAVPAVHPETGRATLYRALYCDQCKQWRAVPPPEVYPGNPMTYPCPKHRRPMSANGPIPAR